MRDKEFDRLFSSGLDKLEVEPSPMVWENVTNQLGRKKTKRSFVTFLSVAASIIILVSVGLLFFNEGKKETITKPGKNNRIVAGIKPGVIAQPYKTDAQFNDNKMYAKLAAVPHKPIKPIVEPLQVSDGHYAINTGAWSQEEQVNAPLVATQEIITLQPAVPSIEIPLTPKVLALEPPVINGSQPAVAKAETPGKSSAKKRGISGLGGLINALVAKVDKREDKIVEFAESNDDGALLSGVNLGLLKFKKQQQDN